MDLPDYNLISPDTTLDNSNWSSENDYETNNKTYKITNAGYILKTMSITFYCIIFVLGIIGNGLVIWIAGFRMKKTISAVWFLNLAIADFLCCASLPLRIAQWAYLFDDSRFAVCILTIILFTINMSASVFLLTAMSIDRCVSVMWPFWAKVHRTCKVVKIAAAIIWLLSLLLTGLLSSLYGFYCGDITECSLSRRIYKNFANIKQTVKMIRLVIMFVIPFLIILTSYVVIFCKLRNNKRSRRSQRPYRIITAVILCFYICFFPYYIWPLTPEYYGDYPQFYTVNTIIYNLACLNSCLDPIIYVLMGQDTKAGFLRSIPARLEIALSQHPDERSREQEGGERSLTTDV